MGGSKSSSSTSTNTSTTTVSDAFNTTTNKVANLSNVGNTSIDFGGAGGSEPFQMSTLLPFAVVAVVGVLGLFLVTKKG